MWHTYYSGSHNFICHQTRAEPYLPSLRSYGTLLYLPTVGWPGWVDLVGWLVNDINFLHRSIGPEWIQSPIPVLTGPGVEQLRWRDQRSHQCNAELSLGPISSTHSNPTHRKVKTLDPWPNPQPNRTPYNQQQTFGKIKTIVYLAGTRDRLIDSLEGYCEYIIVYERTEVPDDAWNRVTSSWEMFHLFCYVWG